MIVTLAKLVLLMLSYLGWWEFFRSRRGIDVSFAPVVTIGAQFSLLFLPGLLNCLPEAATAVYLMGFVLLLDALRREKLTFLKNYWNPGYVLLAMAMVVLLLALRGKKVTWFDNFTHWATVVKNMLAADRFPTFAQKAVGFSTYPLGSSTMVYYFSRLTNEAESFWMLAQAFLMLCTLLPMFACGEKRLLTGIFLALTGNFLLCYNIPLTELLVDTLLPLAGAACLLFLYRTYMGKEEHPPMRYAFVVLFWVLNIKNAGILLVAAGVLLLALDRKKRGQRLKPVAFLLLALLAGYLLWDRHCDYVFDNTDIRQHEISLRYFKQILGGKSLTDACQIVGLLLKKMLLRRELALILAATLLLGILPRFLTPDRSKQYKSLLIFLLLSYVVYAISLMGMYVCSMSLEGALELQSADRYIRIWEIMAWYLLAVYGASLPLVCVHGKWVERLLAVAMICCTLGYYGGLRCFFQFPNYDADERLRNEAPIAEYGVEEGRSYLICADHDVVWEAAFQWAYHLNTDKFGQIHVTETAQLEVADQYDYVVILDQGNPVIEAWVAENYPEQVGKQVIQCFR